MTVFWKVAILFAALGAGCAAEEGDDAPRAPGPWPEPHGYGQLIYDTGSDVTLVLGGDADPETPLRDLWSFDAAGAWSQDGALPMEASIDSAAYHQVADRVIVFVGFFIDWSQEAPFSPVDETWTLDHDTSTWEKLEPAGEVPPGRIGGRMAHDAESDRVVLFGGLDPVTFEMMNDTWAFDLTENRWERMQPAVAPAARNFGSLVYVPAIDRVVLFGGGDWEKVFGDTWVYDYDADTWTELTPATSPPARDYHALVLDPGEQHLFLYGGMDDYDAAGEVPKDDVWTYNYADNTWTEVASPGAPSARAWYGAEYAPSTGAVLVFGGGPSRDTYTNELWSYRHETGDWTQLGPGEPRCSHRRVDDQEGGGEKTPAVTCR